MRSMNMTRIGHDDEQEHLVIFKILELTFFTNKLFLFKFFFAQDLKLVPLSNSRKYQIKTLTATPRRKPVSCTKKRHFRILLGLNKFTYQVNVVAFRDYFSGQKVKSTNPLPSVFYLIVFLFA